MKFLVFSMFDVAKTAEMSAIYDKIQANPTPGTKALAAYTCQGNPFPPTVPPNSLVTISVVEAESNEALAAEQYPVMLAGATIWTVPVLELTIGAVGEQEKKLRP